MAVQKDFRDLLELFNVHNVDYMIIGAHALAFHGAPRYTGDMDILVRADEENAGRILRALQDFGFGSLQLEVADFSSPGKVVQLGFAPVRIDILTCITGVSWETAAAGRVSGTYGDVAVHYIGKAEFIANKRATGRLKDLADVEALGEA